MAIRKPIRHRKYPVHEAIREWNKQLSALSYYDKKVRNALLHNDITPEQVEYLRVALRELYKSANETYELLVKKYKNEWSGGRRLTNQLRRPN